MIEFQRETKEFLAVRVTRNKVAVTSGVEVAISRRGTRATEWTPAVIVNGLTGIIVQGLTPGQYDVWARTDTGVETPVLPAGEISVR